MSSEFVNEKLPAEVLSKLASFRRSGTFCDVIFLVTGSSSTYVRAHKVVLAAASPYFRETLLSDSYVQSEEIRVVVEHVADETLRLLVDYMYTGRLDINEKNVQVLFVAAEILHLDSVGRECLRYLIEHLSISNCMETAVFAKAHNCTDLDDAAFVFARKHFWELVESEELLSMDETSFIHFISDDRLNLKFHGEAAVFEAVINWVKHDPSRQKSLPNVLVGVRLPLVSREFLLDRVYNDPMIQESSACIAMLGAVFHDLLSEKKTSRTIMIAGGECDVHSRLADVNIYDPYSQQWTPAAPLLHPRKFLGMATVGNSIYAVGGAGNFGFLRTIEIYDSQRNSWRAGPGMDCRRYGAGVTALNGTIFAVGGNVGFETGRANEMLDPRQGKWISLPSMMNGRFHCGLAAVNGLLYAAGGYGAQTLNSVEVYDPRACRWTTAQPMLKERRQAGATVFRDQIVVAGGFDKIGMVLSSAEMLTDNGWTFLPEMPLPRQGLGVVDVDGSLFAFGGRDDEDYLSCIEYLDFDSSRHAAEECLLRNHTLSMSPTLWKHPI
ncbi:hypothetical protein Q1695_012179 [Nippostrongylus brasiliensis]|nr:hypothetical protein Q1695_012179 [Nippostrongylus brasiliensis]